MRNLVMTNIGQFRLIGFLEGISLLLLVGIAVPAKHLYGNPELVRLTGLVHGLLFLLFVMNTLRVGVEQGCRFRTTTWKVLVACLIPFGTFYIARQLLRKIKPDGRV